MQKFLINQEVVFKSFDLRVLETYADLQSALHLAFPARADLRKYPILVLSSSPEIQSREGI